MPWKPGESGNPKGRPIGARGLTKQLREALQANDGYLTRWLIAGLVHMAMTKPEGQKIIWDRMEGKVPLPIIGDEDAPIPVIFQFGENGARDPKDMTDAELDAAKEQLDGDDRSHRA